MRLLRFVKRKILYFCTAVIWGVFFFFPIKNNKVVVSNFFGNGYSGNPKYIVERMLDCGNAFSIMWIVNNDSVIVPDGIRKVRINSIGMIYHLSTARIWIDNCRKYHFFIKKKKQFYLQTWHGFALKRIEKDVVDSLNPNYEKIAKKDSASIDLMISDSSFMTNIYKRSFWYNGKIEECGYPRYDVLTSTRKEIAEKVHSHFNIPNDCGIVLYAPTFRQDGSCGIYKFDIMKLLNCLCMKFNKKFVAIIRLHPNVSKSCNIFEYNHEVLPGSLYPDVQELLSASDVLLTDYSSLMFDFAITRKPVFLYLPDLEEYIKERNFYFNLSELPFPYAQNLDCLLRQLLSFDSKKYIISVDQFMNENGIICSGHSSSVVCNLLFEIINRKNHSTNKRL